MTIPAPKLKILVVDDTLTYRAILTRVLNGFDNVEISGTAADGQQALRAMINKPADLVLIDLEMPVMNGLETTIELRKRFPETHIVLISGTNRSSADITLQALEAGAMDFIAKPCGDSFNTNMEELGQRLYPIILTCLEKRKSKVLSINTAAQNLEEIPLPVPLTTPLRAPSTKFDVVAIGVSTGGPNALSEIIPALPGDLGVPVLIIQHMPPIFTASLAGMLDKKSALRVKEAEPTELVLPDTVYIAPGGKHMRIERNFITGKATIVTTDTPPVNSCRPSVDVLFESLPTIYGKRVLSIILTGMGNDGLAGVRQVKAQGGYCLTQSEDSCVVYGMPRSVDEQGLSDERLPLPEIANRIRTLVQATKRGYSVC